MKNSNKNGPNNVPTKELESFATTGVSEAPKNDGSDNATSTPTIFSGLTVWFFQYAEIPGLTDLRLANCEDLNRTPKLHHKHTLRRGYP